MYPILVITINNNILHKILPQKEKKKTKDWDSALWGSPMGCSIAIYEAVSAIKKKKKNLRSFGAITIQF